jgi:hypothetical protein
MPVVVTLLGMSVVEGPFCVNKKKMHMFVCVHKQIVLVRAQESCREASDHPLHGSILFLARMHQALGRSAMNAPLIVTSRQAAAETPHRTFHSLFCDMCMHRSIFLSPCTPSQ